MGNYVKTEYQLECEHCGIPFTGCRKTQRYCCRGCAEKARVARLRAALPDDNLTKVCHGCGTPFKVNGDDHRHRAARYCSDPCRRRAYKASKQGYYERKRLGLINTSLGRPRTLTDTERALRKKQGKGERWFRKYGVEHRCCATENGKHCGETRVLQLAHKVPRHGRWTGCPRQDEVWPLCPTHHTLMDTGLLTATELGLPDIPSERLEWEGVNVISRSKS